MTINLDQTAGPQPAADCRYIVGGHNASREELRAAFRAILNDGGDIVDIALAVRRRRWGRRSVQAAAALHEEFGVSLTEALAFGAWVEADTDADESRAQLRARFVTLLRQPRPGTMRDPLEAGA